MKIKTKKNIDKISYFHVWLKTLKGQNFPKLYQGSAHYFKENSLLLSLVNNNKLAFYLINLNSMNIEEKFYPNLEDCNNFDINFLHYQTFLVNSKVMHYFLIHFYSY